MHGYGWFMSMRQGDEKPKVTRELLLRVLNYAKPYWWHIGGMLVTILLSTGLVSGHAVDLPQHDRQYSAIQKSQPTDDACIGACCSSQSLNGGISVVQRRLNSTVGEGVIYDLRVALFGKLQRMSLRFFTNTKVGELMSRLNNDVVGAQNAISNTIVGIITNLIEAVAILASCFRSNGN